MTRIVIHSRVGGEGVLHLTVPVGTADAGRDVRVTVDADRPPTPSADEWRRAILETAGKWLGDFERPPQGDFERREALP